MLQIEKWTLTLLFFECEILKRLICMKVNDIQFIITVLDS